MSGIRNVSYLQNIARRAFLAGREWAKIFCDENETFRQEDRPAILRFAPNLAL
jgi:hypothetical protein